MLSAQAKLGEFANDPIHTILDFKVCCDELMIDIAENGARRIQGEKKTGRSRKRFEVSAMILVPVCSQDGYESALTAGPSQDRRAITAIGHIAVRRHLARVYHTTELLKSR